MLKLCVRLLAIVGLTFGAAARADEEKVPLDKLPAKVKDAVKAKFPDAEFVSASKEIEDKVLLYEVKIKSKKQTIEVTVTEDGKIVEIEAAIAPGDLPKAVVDSLFRTYGPVNFLKVEDIVKGDKKYYEVLIVHARGARKTEVEIDKDGKILHVEDKTFAREEGSAQCAPVQRRFGILRMRDRGCSCCGGLLGGRCR